ncbi:MAG: hypothetical protein ACK4K9_00795 [Bacteroidia bacterium]
MGIKYKYILLCFLILLNPIFGVKAQQTNDFKVSVMLPFNSKLILQNNRSTEKQLSDVCREYYQGVLVALDSLGNTESNLNITLKVFDTKKDSITIKKHLQNDFVKQSNIVIGPALREGQIMMQNFSNQNRVYRISPFLTFTKSSINDSMLISFNPDLYSYADILLNYLKNTGFDDINLILIKGSTKNNEIIYKRFKEIEKGFASIKINYIDVYNSAKLKEYYKPLSSNYIFIISEDESVVNVAINYMAEVENFENATVFGLKKWLDFKGVSAQNWQKLNVTVLTPFYADLNNEEVKWFSKKYLSKYNTLPSEFAFEGYRQFMYLVQAYQKTNGNFAMLQNIENIKIFGLKNKIGSSFKSGSLYNRRLNMVRLENFELKLVD